MAVRGLTLRAISIFRSSTLSRCDVSEEIKSNILGSQPIPANMTFCCRSIKDLAHFRLLWQPTNLANMFLSAHFPTNLCQDNSQLWILSSDLAHSVILPANWSCQDDGLSVPQHKKKSYVQGKLIWNYSWLLSYFLQNYNILFLFRLMINFLRQVFHYVNYFIFFNQRVPCLVLCLRRNKKLCYGSQPHNSSYLSPFQDHLSRFSKRFGALANNLVASHLALLVTSSRMLAPTDPLAHFPANWCCQCTIYFLQHMVDIMVLLGIWLNLAL